MKKTLFYILTVISGLCTVMAVVVTIGQKTFMKGFPMMLAPVLSLMAIVFVVCIVIMIKNSNKQRKALENQTIPENATNAVVYISGNSSVLWGLLNFGKNKRAKIESQLNKWVSQGWDIAPFQKNASKNVLFGLYKSTGWFVALKK